MTDKYYNFNPADYEKHILIGKMGKSVKIKQIKVGTGDDAPIIFYAFIAKMNPTFMFYFIGPNHLDKLTDEEYDKIFPNHNVLSANCVNYGKLKEHTEHDYKPIVDWFKNRGIKPDFMLFFNGVVSGNGNIEHFLKLKTGEYKKQLLCFAKYAAPYIYVMDQMNDVPVYVISEDPRYISVNATDLYNNPKLVLSQTNGRFKTHYHIKSWTDHTFKDDSYVDAEYMHTEKICMMGVVDDFRDKIDIDRKLKSDPSTHLIVLSNGCGTAHINHNGNNSSRYPEYEKWIINGLKGTEYDGTMIYGKWDKWVYEKTDRIKEIMIENLKDEMGDARYTLVYSQIPGFITIKPYEMITMGLLPFLHPDYDKDRLLNFPEYLYLKDVDDMIAKMRELDANPDKYVALLNECFDLIKPEFIDGSYLNNLIFNRIAELEGFEYENKKGIDMKVNRRDSNMFGV